MAIFPHSPFLVCHCCSGLACVFATLLVHQVTVADASSARLDPFCPLLDTAAALSKTCQKLLVATHIRDGPWNLSHELFLRGKALSFEAPLQIWVYVNVQWRGLPRRGAKGYT